MLGNDDSPSPLRPASQGGMSRAASAPARAAVDTLLPCDDPQFELGVVHHARTSIEAVDHHARAARPGTGGHCSRPGTGWSCSASSSLGRSSWETGSPLKSLSGRFSSEELACFRRVYSPSPQCASKADVYFQTTGDMKRALVAENWHSLPTLKGKFYSKAPLAVDGMSSTMSNQTSRRSVRVELLPDEVLTSKILNDIWPRTPGKREDGEDVSSPRSPDKLASPMSTIGHGTQGEELLRAFKDEAKKVHKLIRFNQSKTLALDGTFGSVGTPPSTAPEMPKTPKTPARSPTGAAKNIECQGLGTCSPVTPLAAMMDFRKLLIERYHSMDEAVKLLCGELQDPSIMTKKDFRRSLQKYNLNLTKEERDAVFKHLDIDGDGNVSMIEMDIGIQAASPVKNLADLRRRWLAGGIMSLGHAIRIMDDMGTSLGNRLTLREFGEVLTCLHVAEHEEHLLLFNAVLDPSARSSRVAMLELVAALATLSPAMLLEDVRSFLNRKYGGRGDGGHFERAFADLDVDHRGFVFRQDFAEKAAAKFGLTEYMARKLYREIDVDESGRVTREEFLCALALSEPSLFMEELRRKVLQRFRSIQVAFRRAFAGDDARENEKPWPLPLDKFQEMLLPLEFTEEETARLFSLIDVADTGMLTVSQFVKGTLQFVPSWAFEDLRLLCLSRNSEISDIFADVEVSPTQPLDWEAFCQIMDELGLGQGVKVSAIFDMMDVMHEGQITLGRLVAALQAGGPGNAQKLSEVGLHTYAKEDARGCIRGAHRLVGDLRSQVRQGPEDPAQQTELAQDSKQETSPSRAGNLRKNLARKMMALFGGSGGQRSGNQIGQRSSSQTEGTDGGRACSGSSSPKGKAKKHLSAGHRSPVRDCGEKMEAKKATPEKKKATPALLKRMPQEDIKFYLLHQALSPAAGPPKPPPNPRKPDENLTPSMSMMNDNQSSWNQVWNRLHTAAGQQDRQILEKDIHSYYQTATWSLSHDVPLLEKVESRHAVHTNARKHTQALETEKQKAVYRSLAPDGSE